MTTYRLVVRNEGEWGEFFVHEYDPVVREHKSGSYKVHSATWCCHSSYGCFGYYWGSMGSPFAKFIQDVDSYYLLNKISNKVTDDKLVLKNVRESILRGRHNQSFDKDQAREAWDSVEYLADEHTGEALCSRLYSEINLDLGWSEMSTTDFTPAAKQFAKILWPEFVRMVKEHHDASRSDSNCFEQTA